MSHFTSLCGIPVSLFNHLASVISHFVSLCGSSPINHFAFIFAFKNLKKGRKIET